MNGLHALLPGLVAGVLSIFMSWFWMGFLFHRFQQLTPNTWRRETGTSYALSSALHVLAAIGIAVLFAIVTRAQSVFSSRNTGCLHIRICLLGRLRFAHRSGRRGVH